MSNDENDRSRTVRLPADEPVSSGDLILDEIEGEGFRGDDDRVADVGDGGLEAVEGFRLPGTDPTPEVAEVPSLLGLPDVATASFDIPAIAAESIIGQDERRQISPADAFPWRVHASLRITAADGARFVGTGFFISPRVLATAGHCVFLQSSNRARGGWVRSVDVMPGRDGDDLPYGRATATRFYSVRGWTDDGDPEYD